MFCSLGARTRLFHPISAELLTLREKDGSLSGASNEWTCCVFSFPLYRKRRQVVTSSSRPNLGEGRQERSQDQVVKIIFPVSLESEFALIWAAHGPDGQSHSWLRCEKQIFPKRARREETVFNQQIASARGPKVDTASITEGRLSHAHVRPVIKISRLFSLIGLKRFPTPIMTPKSYTRKLSRIKNWSNFYKEINCFWIKLYK